MIIVSHNKIDLKQFGKASLCEIHSVHVKVKSIKSKARQMITAISDTSWIRKLGVVEQDAYTARATQTIEKIVTQILKKVSNKVTDDFGEYLVTDTARNALENEFNHKVIPISELWKEKLSGNPGFDFHTVSPANIVAFGESKYSATKNTHTVAMKQIVSFIEKKKDIMDLIDLQNFVSPKAITNIRKNRKAFVAAFSINGQEYDQIFKTAYKSAFIDPLLNYSALYLIGIEV